MMKIGQALLQSTRSQSVSEHHQVVIVHPDEITVPAHAIYSLSEFRVDLAVLVPICGIKLAPGR